MNRYAPPPLTPARISLHGIPKGYMGTRKTLEHVQHMVRQGAKDFYVRQKAVDILMQAGVNPKDYLGEIQALFEWVQKSVRYTKDPYRVEVLHSARRMLELLAGDCDDMTILLAAMLEAIGHPTRLVIIGPDPSRPRLFSHIYLEVNHRGKWIPLDPTMPFGVGWAPNALIKQVISIDRRNPKMFGDMQMQGTEVSMSADWLPGLAQNIMSGAMSQRDPRIRQLYDLLRQRQLWARSPNTRRILRFAWKNGLADRQRPRTGTWFMWRLRSWGLLPGQPGLRPMLPVNWVARRPFRRVGLRPYPRVGPRPLRPLGLRPLRRVGLSPVQVRPVHPVRVSVAPRPLYRPRR